MARLHKPKKTKTPSIYETISSAGKKEYLATWTQKGHRYIEKNLTRIFGANTEKQAEKKLTEIQVLISMGEDPFKKEEPEVPIPTLSELVLSEIKSRRATKDYKYMQEKIYKKHIEPKIGNIPIDAIDIDTLRKVFQTLKTTETDSTIFNVVKTIKPTLEYAADKGHINKNPLDTKTIKKLISVNRKGNKPPLQHRLSGRDDNKYLKTAKLLYDAALKYKNPKANIVVNNEFQIAFLMAIMTARRRSEILKIKYEDITTYNTVKTRAETTKTDVWEEYPLPKEVISRLTKKGQGLIIKNISPNLYSTHMRKLIDNLSLPLHSDMKLRGHDTRNLFLTIMSKKTKNPFLCDTAISHEQSKYKMLLTYYKPDINDHIELFEQYWDLLRNKKPI